MSSSSLPPVPPPATPGDTAPGDGAGSCLPLVEVPALGIYVAPVPWLGMGERERRAMAVALDGPPPPTTTELAMGIGEDYR